MGNLTALYESIADKKEELNPNIQDKKISILVGRFQPPTKAHIYIASKAKHPLVVVCVRGPLSSKDHEKNPFSFDMQRCALEQLLPNVKEVIEFTSGFIPGIASVLRDKGYETVELICGSDRTAGYKKLIDEMDKSLNMDIKISPIERNNYNNSPSGDESIENISGTLVRKAFESNKLSVVQDLTGLPESTIEEMKKEFDDDPRKVILFFQGPNTIAGQAATLYKKIIKLQNINFKVICLDETQGIPKNFTPSNIHAAIGFDRGALRIDSLPNSIIKIKVGIDASDAIANPKDNFNSDEPNKSHFVLNNTMMKELKERLNWK